MREMQLFRIIIVIENVKEQFGASYRYTQRHHRSLQKGRRKAEIQVISIVFKSHV